MNEKELAKAKQITYRLLRYRIRSEKELAKRLKQKKISKSVIKTVLEDCKRLSLVDDRVFTKLWIKDKFNRGYGFLRIRRELREKGIEEELINQCKDAFKKEYRTDLILDELIKKRVKRYKHDNPKEIKRKLFVYLHNRGFSFEEIERALAQL